MVWCITAQFHRFVASSSEIEPKRWAIGGEREKEIGRGGEQRIIIISPKRIRMLSEIIASTDLVHNQNLSTEAETAFQQWAEHSWRFSSEQNNSGSSSIRKKLSAFLLRYKYGHANEQQFGWWIRFFLTFYFKRNENYAFEKTAYNKWYVMNQWEPGKLKLFGIFHHILRLKHVNEPVIKNVLPMVLWERERGVEYWSNTEKELNKHSRTQNFWWSGCFVSYKWTIFVSTV